MIELIKNNFFNKEVNVQLTNIIKNKSFANGYIFYGADGIGKKEAALEFIREIFKQFSLNENLEKKLTNKNHPDFLVIEPSTNSEANGSKVSDTEKTKKIGTGIIKINQIRTIKTFLGQKPIDSEKKIVLIIDAHLLNEAASNCLLKTLEETSNGIFILLTSKLNTLLDTIISRCQLIRFQSLSSKQIESTINDFFDSSKLEILKKLNFQDLINSANGSPGQLLKNIEILNNLSVEILNKLNTPLKDIIEIFEFSKLISEKLDTNQQIYLVNLIQTIWWRSTNNSNLVKKLESLKSHLKNNIQAKLAWEITFLKIYLEDL